MNFSFIDFQFFAWYDNKYQTTITLKGPHQMDLINQYFLSALKAHLQGVPAPITEDLTAEQWEHFMQQATAQNVLPMIYAAVCDNPSLNRNHPSLLATVRQTAFRNIAIQTRKTSEFLALQKRLHSAQIQPLVVKGLMCRCLYPDPDARESGDEDLLISPDDFNACHGVMITSGMETTTEPEKIAYSYEVPYRKEGSPLYIELHKSLFPPESDAYGDFNRFFEKVHERSVIQDVTGVPIRTMCPTDHMFYLICHAFKHFLHSGFGIRQVCDIALYANAYGRQLDWATIVANCRAIHAEGFCMAVLRIGKEYLTLDVEKACLPPVWRDLKVDETLMLEDLLTGGLYGDSDMNRKHSSSITLDAVAAEKKGRRARGGLLASLFPSLRIMAVRFRYLEKAPWLLPFAWIHRILLYNKENRAIPGNSAADTLKIGRERVEMMRSYGIIK